MKLDTSSSKDLTQLPSAPQVLNTDAEGRLTLADALVYAEKNCQAEAIIDVATLTGACMVALGTSMCGMFSPNQQLISQLKQAGSKAGQPTCQDLNYRLQPARSHTSAGIEMVQSR